MTDKGADDSQSGDGLKTIGAILVLVAAGLVIWSTTAPRNSTAAGAALGEVELRPLLGDGPPIDRAALVGKVTLINFWATWCPPCIAEFPHLQRTYLAHRSRPEFQFLSVATGHPSLESLRAETKTFLAERGFDVPVYYDPGERTWRSLQGVDTRGIPVTLLIDRDGRIVNVAIGSDEAKLEEIDLQIASLLKDANK